MAVIGRTHGFAILQISFSHNLNQRAALNKDVTCPYLKLTCLPCTKTFLVFPLFCSENSYTRCANDVAGRLLFGVSASPPHHRISTREGKSHRQII